MVELGVANIMDKIYFIYILTNRIRGVLYLGMTSDLPGRMWEHRERVFDGFTKKYGITRLVYYEMHMDPAVAARREKLLKRWRRQWKIKLVEASNPGWRELFEEVCELYG